jgi:hypothetical protein
MCSHLPAPCSSLQQTGRSDLIFGDEMTFVFRLRGLACARAYLAAHTDSSRTDRRLTLSGVFAERQNSNVSLQSAEPSRVTSSPRLAGIHGVASEESIDASRPGRSSHDGAAHDSLGE